MRLFRLPGFIFLMICPMLKAAAAPSLILSSQDVYSVNEHFDWVTTPASVVDYQSALEFFDSAQAIPTDGINLGFTEGVVWLRANLISHSSRDSWILEFAYPHLDDVDVYVFQGARAPIIHEYGDGLPFDARFRRHRTINAEIQVPPGETVQVCLGCSRQCSTDFVSLSKKGFETPLRESSGLYYGLMGIMMVYHLILFYRRECVGTFFMPVTSVAGLDDGSKRYVLSVFLLNPAYGATAGVPHLSIYFRIYSWIFRTQRVDAVGRQVAAGGDLLRLGYRDTWGFYSV